jgi:hypothetical protein
MQNYYSLTTALYTALSNDPLVNKVTKGSLDKITNAKQDMYPLCHIIYNDSKLNGSTNSFSVSFVCMSIVDISKDSVTNEYIGNDNEDDVLNTTHGILNRLFDSLRRGALSNDGYRLNEETAVCEPFVDRFTDAVAGWTMTLDITIDSNSSIC